MDIFRLAVFCVAACILLKLMGSAAPQAKTAASLLAVCMAAGVFFGGFSELSAAVKELYDSTGLDGQYIRIVFKSLGICYITQISCDICRDNGENALASQLELCGKAALLLTAMPMFSAAADMIKELLVF